MAINRATATLQAFWCFVALMQRLGCNFDRDQTACQLQLAALGRLVALLDPPLHAVVKAAACTDMLFCFRWMLVGLKREFPLAEVPGLWEALWTNPLTPHLHLYVALVLLELRRCAPSAAVGLENRYVLHRSGLGVPCAAADRTRVVELHLTGEHARVWWV